MTQLRAEQLEAQLAKSLAPVYAIHGDEPLMALEAADAVRAAARKQGYSERVVFEPTRTFDWSELRHAGAGGSLFGERKIVERVATGKPAAPFRRRDRRVVRLAESGRRPRDDAEPQGADWESRPVQRAAVRGVTSRCRPAARSAGRMAAAAPRARSRARRPRC